VQILRPNWLGHGSDQGGRRTPWIIGGMAVLGAGGLVATLGTVAMGTHAGLGIGLAVLGFALIGGGVGASGTSLLALLATATEPSRRAAAATITWLMMIFGIAVTAAGVGAVLDPYSHGRLVAIVACVCLGALALTVLAIRGVEARLAGLPEPQVERVAFRVAFAEIWGEPRARRFAIFVFLSMTAYFMQELIIEPFAGHVFRFTPGQSTSMAGLQNGGVFLGMLTVGVAASGLKIGSLKMWTVAGCLGSAAALGAIAMAGMAGPGAPLLPLVFGLGFANGVFAVAAIGSMMALAGDGRAGREGTRMGLFGAAQAVAAGFGGFLGAAMVDAMRRLVADPAEAYGTVFMIEAALFVGAALLALRVVTAGSRPQLAPGE
jgi:MFS transporter, BCD family, chlorophyll transporter